MNLKQKKSWVLRQQEIPTSWAGADEQNEEQTKMELEKRVWEIIMSIGYLQHDTQDGASSEVRRDGLLTPEPR